MITLDNTMLIGLKHSTSSGAFEWQDGTQLNYTNWNEMEPNGDGSCVIMLGDKWIDFNCESQKQYACQRSIGK